MDRRRTLMFEPARQNGGSVDLTRQAATQSELVALPGVADATAASWGAAGRRARSATPST